LPVRATSERSRVPLAVHATLFELPGHDAVQDVGARFDAEYGVVQLDIASLGCVQGFDSLTFMA
jgi:hypothetical protein